MLQRFSYLHKYLHMERFSHQCCKQYFPGRDNCIRLLAPSPETRSAPGLSVAFRGPVLYCFVLYRKEVARKQSPDKVYAHGP